MLATGLAIFPILVCEAERNTPMRIFLQSWCVTLGFTHPVMGRRITNWPAVVLALLNPSPSHPGNQQQSGWLQGQFPWRYSGKAIRVEFPEQRKTRHRCWLGHGVFRGVAHGVEVDAHRLVQRFLPGRSLLPPDHLLHR